MSSIYRFLVLAIVILFCAITASATHIMGGDIAYEYMGQQGSGDYRYKVTFTIYGDAVSNWPTPMTDILFGVYMEGADPNADKILVDEYQVNLSYFEDLTPELPPGCSFNQDIQAWKAVYETVIDLPITFGGIFSNGYHIYYDVCCRNNTIVNLQFPGGTGNSFYAFIPSPLIENNSPVFSDEPVPFICAGDTTPLLNTAFDPDGDLLIFSFEEPYSGYSSTSNPQPVYSSDINPLTWPIPQVTWAGGYNMTQPFGTSGYSTINGFTGYSEYVAPLQGPFVVCVEVKEYRNGNLIGITRRDMQFQVVNCQNNPAPDLTNTAATGDTLGSGNTTYSIEEGDTLCFDISFDDPNNDNITLSSSGDIFNSSQFNPNATINTPQVGVGNVESTFCWETGCDQGRGQPYLFTVNATDDGCAPKTAARVYSIQINDFEGPTTIIGPSIACEGATGIQYSVNSTNGAAYNWTVIGGNIIAGQNSNSVTVNWTQDGIGEIKVEVTSKNGCPSPEINKLVTVNDVDVDAGLDTSICYGDTLQIGGNPTAPAGFNYSWSPSASLNNSTTSNPLAFPATSTDYILTVTDGNGCEINDTISITVFEFVPTVIGDTSLCSNDTITLFASGGDIYNWQPSDSTFNVADSTVDISPDTPTTFFVTVTTSDGCLAYDSVQVDILSAPNANITGIGYVCPGDTTILSATGGTSYIWNPTSSLSPINDSIVKAHPVLDTYYNLTITNANGCIDTTGFFVSASPNVPTEAGNDTIICVEGEAVLGGYPVSTFGSTFSWTPVANLDNPTNEHPIATISSSTWFYVETSNDTCSGVDSVFVDLFVSPIADAGTDSAICFGDSIQLIASGGLVYSWSDSLLLNFDTINSPIAAPNDTTLFYVSVTDANSCTGIDSVLITVNPLPTANAGNDIQLCIADTALLAASGGEEYLWYPDSSLSSTTNESAYSWTDTTQTYIVQVTDSNQCVNTDTTTVFVNYLPIVDAGMDTYLCPSDTVLLEATGGTTYQWTVTDSMDFDTSSTPNVWPVDTTLYVVLVTDSNGCVNTDSVQVNVNAVVPTDAGIDTSFCFLDSLVIGGNPTAPLGTDYSWFGGEINDSTLANPTVSPTLSGYYYVATTNHICNGIDSVFVNVNPLPNVNIELNDTQLCIFDSLLITTTGASTYSWSPNTFTAIGSDSIIAHPTDTTRYIVIGTDNNGCSNADSVWVDVNPLPNVVISGDIELCFGDTTTLIAGGANSYNWNVSTSVISTSNNSLTTNPVATSTYVVMGTDTNSCVYSDTTLVTVHSLPVVSITHPTQVCIGDTALLEANGGISYEWNWDNTSSTNNPLINFPQDTTNYFVMVTDSNGCKNTDSAVVHVNQLPIVSISGDNQMCLGSNIQLTANGAETYDWLPANFVDNPTAETVNISPFDTTTFVAIGVDSNGCSGIGSFLVIVNPIPVVDLGSDQSICRNSPTVIGIQNPETDASYSWSPSTYLSDSTIANPTISADTSISYTVFMEDSNGCTSFNNIMFSVFRINNQSDSGICERKGLSINVVPINATPPIVYSFAPQAGVVSSSFGNYTLQPNETTTYTIAVTDAKGCIERDTFRVIINEAPLVDFEFEILPTCDGMETVFSNASSGEQFLWDFGNGNTSTDENPTTTLPYGQNVTISLVAENSNGCSDSTNTTIPVDELSNYVPVSPPSIFTPNGDGINDRFEIIGDFNLDGCINMEVYNRWGTLMYGSYENKAVWDGSTYSGIQVPEGVYFYVVTINELVFNGSVTLSR